MCADVYSISAECMDSQTPKTAKMYHIAGNFGELGF